MKKWHKKKERLVYDGWRKMIVKTFLLPNGVEFDFDIIGNGAYITVAAFTDKKEAILVRQFRPGPEMIMTSFPEGYIDAGESFVEAAKRELLEETGYEAGKISYLKTFHKAYSTEKQICVLALNCKKVSDQQTDDEEFIEVAVLSFPKFKELIKNPNDESFANTDAAYLALEQLETGS